MTFSFYDIQEKIYFLRFSTLMSFFSAMVELLIKSCEIKKLKNLMIFL